MVRRVKVEILCTPCHWEGKEVEGTTIPITIGGKKGEVDICVDCEAAVLTPLRTIMMGGDKPVQKGLFKVAQTEPICCFMEDGFSATSANSLHSHMNYAHHIGAGALVDKCPICGVEYQGGQALGQHTSAQHGTAGLLAALWAASQDGDKHGTVAEARRRVRAAEEARAKK